MDPISPRKYPGRSRVVPRDQAVAEKWREAIALDTGHDPLACTDPKEVPAIGLPSITDRNTTKVPVTLRYRCRKCSGCLAHRRRLWTARAIDEIDVARRTWFGTLTFRPEVRFLLTMRAHRICSIRRREPFEKQPSADQFQLLANEANREVTKFLKRLRKQANVPLRYLLVVEAHRDGFPHLHILLHEPADPVRKAVLDAQWRAGFSQWRLVGNDAGAATYACKYLAKGALTRVRASRHYGQAHKLRLLTERAENARDTVMSALRGTARPVKNAPEK